MRMSRIAGLLSGAGSGGAETPIVYVYLDDGEGYELDGWPQTPGVEVSVYAGDYGTQYQISRGVGVTRAEYPYLEVEYEWVDDWEVFFTMPNYDVIVWLQYSGY